MRLKCFAITLFSATVLSLAYTWQQIEIIKLAYQGSRTNKIYKELLDRNHYLRYNLLNLKSSLCLGSKLFDENTPYEIPKQSQIISLVVPKGARQGNMYAEGRGIDSEGSLPKKGIFLGALKLQDVGPIAWLSAYINNQAQAQDISNQ